MAQEQLTRTDSQVPSLLNSDERNALERRLQYEHLFEQALEGLVDRGKILGWYPADNQEQEEYGNRYWVQTEAGTIPFALSSTHRKAQLKRSKHPELKHSTVTIRYPQTGATRTASKLRRQVFEGIRSVLELQENIEETG